MTTRPRAKATGAALPAQNVRPGPAPAHPEGWRAAGRGGHLGTLSRVTQPTPDRRHVALLTNPASGHGKGGRAIQPVLDRLRASGVRVDHVAEDGRDAAEAAVREVAGQGADLILSVGGDGTHGVALQAAVATGTPLGVVPAGTGNDLARALRIPRSDLGDAVTLALEAPVRSIDVGRVRTGEQERFFATIVTAGFDSLVTDRTNAMRWPNGKARYLLAIGMEYFRLAPRDFRVEIDGELVHDGPAILTAVGNTESYGGGMRILPTADPADGLLDVTILEGVRYPRVELPAVLPRIMRGTHATHRAVRTLRGRRVRLESGVMNAYADGDPVGALPVTIDVVPGALQVAAPSA